MAKKVPWEEKYRRIVAQYPEVVHTNWSELLRNDSDIFAQLLGDVLKSGTRGSKPGKRPTLDRSEALERLAKVTDQDFSEFNFHETFRLMTKGYSVRGIAAKTGLGKSYVQRLLHGEAEPSFATMEQIANGFKKHPSFFLEYRIAKTLVVIDSLLHDSPETATAWYLKFSKVK